MAGVGLLLLVGCNQIFGLTPTGTWDAPVDPIHQPHVVFTWQLTMPLPSGAPAPALSYPPFKTGEISQIRIAPLDGAFLPAEYRANAGMEGWIPLPNTYPGTTWRLEYMLPGSVPIGVPHEVQWQPDDTAHLTVPMVGRLDRDPVPARSGYTITPSNFAGPYGNPRVLTTGLWTEGLITAPITGVTVDYDFPNNAKTLSGPNGSPDPSQGDRALLVDFVTDTAGSLSCRVAAGSASFDATLQPGTHTMQTASWNASRPAVNAPAVDPAFIARLTDDPLHGTFSAGLSVQLYGAVPSTDFPGLTGTPSSFLMPMIRLPIPVMQILLQCPYNRNPLPPPAAPPLLDNHPRVLHIQLVAVRNVLGVDLISGLETVLASTGFKLAFPAPLATRMTLDTPTKGTIDLAGASDQLDIGAPAGTFLLKFVPEAGLDLRADYHDVALRRITGSGLTTERIFTVTAPRVQIDGALLAPKSDYVLEIRTIKGHPMASRGNFVPVDYPYGAAIVYTRTFKTS